VNAKSDSTQRSVRGGSGTPLISCTLSWRAWRPVLGLLAPHHDVFAPTMAGHRDGPVLSVESSLDAVADQIERDLDDAGLETAHFAGNSMGGFMGAGDGPLGTGPLGGRDQRGGPLALCS
jgi:hypothetical protein